MKRYGRRLAAAAALVMLGMMVGTTSALADARFERYAYQGRSQESAQVGPGQYRNPVLSGYYPDPSITRVGDDYYLVNSSFTHFPGLPVFHSRDLVTWTQIGNAIDRPAQLRLAGLTASRGVYAPDISHHDGQFYIVNTCVDCGGNFVITAKDPHGPWSDPVWLGFDGIDPSIFWDGDEAYIVNNGPPPRAPRYDGHRAIWVQRFDHRRMTLTGERSVIVDGGVDIRQKPSWIEGPHLLRRGDAYYLIAAEGGTGDQHTEVVFRASSVRGPFQPWSGNPILSQRGLDPARADPVTSAGHAKFVQTPAGDWWAVFLATRPYAPGLYNIGRETFLLPVRWDAQGWPTILAPGVPIPFVAERPRLPPQTPPQLPISGDFGYVDEFDAPQLGPAWIGLRIPPQPFHRIERGALVLRSGAPLGDVNGVPAFLGRRQQHHVATVATTLSFTPARPADRAGLVAMQNDTAWLFFGLAQVGGRPVLALIARDRSGPERVLASAPFDLGTVTLILNADGGRIRADYESAGQRRTLGADIDARFLSTEYARGFVGTVIGPYVYQ